MTSLAPRHPALNLQLTVFINNICTTIADIKQSSSIKSYECTESLKPNPSFELKIMYDGDQDTIDDPDHPRNIIWAETTLPDYNYEYQAAMPRAEEMDRQFWAHLEELEKLLDIDWGAVEELDDMRSPHYKRHPAYDPDYEFARPGRLAGKARQSWMHTARRNRTHRPSPPPHHHLPLRPFLTHPTSAAPALKVRRHLSLPQLWHLHRHSLHRALHRMPSFPTSTKHFEEAEVPGGGR